jgi:hypothetical protein
MTSDGLLMTCDGLLMASLIRCPMWGARCMWD